jgi:hypothetical protein
MKSRDQTSVLLSVIKMGLVFSIKKSSLANKWISFSYSNSALVKLVFWSFCLNSNTGLEEPGARGAFVPQWQISQPFFQPGEQIMPTTFLLAPPPPHNINLVSFNFSS